MGQSPGAWWGIRRSFTKVWVAQVSQVSGCLSTLVQRRRATQLIIYEATPGHVGGVCGPVIGEQGGHLCVSSKFPGGWFFAASRCQEQREGKFLKEGPGSGELDIVNTQDSVTLVICPSRQGPVLEELKMRLTPMQKEYKPSIAFSSSVRESVRGRS